MSDLAPTPSRLNLLTAVASGQIEQQAGHWWDTLTSYRCDARVAEVIAAGWVEAAPHLVLSGAELARLTEAGRAVLERGRSR